MKQYVALAIAVTLPLATASECEADKVKADPAPVVKCETDGWKHFYGTKKSGREYKTCGGEICYYRYKIKIKGQVEPVEKLVRVKYPKTITLPVRMEPGSFKSSHCNKWYVKK